MRIRLSYILLSIFIATPSLFLKAQQYRMPESTYNTTWQQNAFSDNWYVSFGGGAQILLSEDDSKGDFGSRLTFAPSLTVGKYFSPIFGVRINATGGSLHGFNDGLDGTYRRWSRNFGSYQGGGYAGMPGYPDNAGPAFMSWDPSWLGRGPEFMKDIANDKIENNIPIGNWYWVPGHEGKVYMQHVRYMAINFNGQINLTELFKKYIPERRFGFSLFGGPTLFHVFSHAGTRPYNYYGINIGMNAKIKMNDFADFFAEASGNLYPDDFDGHIGGSNTGDIVMQLTAGISCKIGKQYWERCDHADYGLIARLNDEINRLRNKPCCPLIEPKPPVPNLRVTYIQPEEEKIKKREISGEAFVIFPVGRTELNPTLGNNSAELGKVTKSIDYVSEEKDITIDQIYITGYASPEGNEQSNFHLSEGRSRALTDYIRIMYNLDPNLFIVRSNGENWDGLVDILDRTSLTEQEKFDVKNIITNTYNVATRKSRLQSYQGGKVYRYLLNEIYPSLRRTDYKIEFTVPQFTVERGRELINTKSEMLSQYEMYQVANSYPKGSPEFIRSLETALVRYPNDPVANINAAAIALERNELDRAATYLEKVKTDPRALNDLAVLYMLQGKTEDATTYFKLAVENGDEKAAQNLKEMNGISDKMLKYKEDMQEYLEALERSKTGK